SAPPELYPLSLHAALPISWTPYKLFHLTNDFKRWVDNQIHSICPKIFQMVNTVLHTNQIVQRTHSPEIIRTATPTHMVNLRADRSEEHTSELQSREKIVCR